MLYGLSINIALQPLSKGVIGMMKKKILQEEKSDDDLGIYSKDMRESLLDDDELSPMEEAFMSGYEEAV